MKVLWFTNTPAAGEGFMKEKAISGGWLKSLDQAIQEYLDLHIAFNFAKFYKSFKYNKTHYYPICHKNWKLHIIKRHFFPGLIDDENIDKYMELINKINPDIIHINGSENSYCNILDKISIPVIVSLQGIVTVIHNKYFAGIEKEYLSVKNNLLGQNFKSALFSKSFKHTYANFIKMSRREIKNFSSAKYVIGRTDWDRRVSSILAPNRRYFHLDEILRDSFYTHQWIFKTNEPFIIFSTSANSFFKGFESICMALHNLITIGISIEWKVAGISKNDLIVKIVKSKLGNKYPKKGLILLGQLSEHELLMRLMEANIFVMASHIENSSNSLCEAMILGMPCIATFVGGTGSILKDKEEGILVQDGDPWAIAGAILELQKNTDMAVKYGANARIRALKRHDPNTISKKLLAIYKELLN